MERSSGKKSGLGIRNQVMQVPASSHGILAPDF